MHNFRLFIFKDDECVTDRAVLNNFDQPPSTVADGEDGTVDGGRWEHRYRRRWPVPSTVAGTVDGGIFNQQYSWICVRCII